MSHQRTLDSPRTADAVAGVGDAGKFRFALSDRSLLNRHHFYHFSNAEHPVKSGMQLRENKTHKAAAAQNHIRVPTSSFHQSSWVRLSADYLALIAAGDRLHRRRRVHPHYYPTLGARRQHPNYHQRRQHFPANRYPRLIYQNELFAVSRHLL